MPDLDRNNPLTLARFEVKRFRGPLPRLALAFILLIPMLYGCIYLAGNWDPYGRLDNVPVAIVNHDEPTTFNGKGELLQLTIEEQLVRPENTRMLQDLVLAAVNEGLRKAKEQEKTEMVKLTGGMRIPGLI